MYKNRLKYLYVLLVVILCVGCKQKNPDKVQDFPEQDDVSTASDATESGSTEQYEISSNINFKLEGEGYSINIYANADIKDDRMVNTYLAKKRPIEKNDLEDMCKSLGGEIISTENDDDNLVEIDIDYEGHEYKLGRTEMYPNSFYINSSINEEFCNGFGVSQDNYLGIENGISQNIIENTDDISEDLKPYVEKARAIISNLKFDKLETEYRPIAYTIDHYYGVDKTTNEKMLLKSGYTFIFAKSVDELEVEAGEFVRETEQDKYIKLTDMNLKCINECFENVSISLTEDNDLYEMFYQGIMEISEKDASNVRIIDKNTAFNIICEELMTNPRHNDGSLYFMKDETDSINPNSVVNYYNCFCLEYVRLYNKSQDSYIIVPAWCLKENSLTRLQAAVVVNGLDGSIIDIGKEIHYLEEER